MVVMIHPMPSCNVLWTLYLSCFLCYFFPSWYWLLLCLLSRFYLYRKLDLIQQVLWSFSLYLEAVAILPQLVLLQRSRNIDNLTGNYVFLLGYVLSIVVCLSALCLLWLLMDISVYYLIYGGMLCFKLLQGDMMRTDYVFVIFTPFFMWSIVGKSSAFHDIDLLWVC